MLPADGCSLEVPEWPIGEPSADESTLWERLWRLPVAEFWHDQRIDPHVVAGYVTGWLSNPLNTTCARLASELALTPAGLRRLRLVVEDVEAEGSIGDPYEHLR